MSIGNTLNEFMEEKLLSLHTAFIGQIVSIKAGKARVQPLSMIKQYGQEAIQPAVIDDVPIPKSLYKIELFPYIPKNDPSHTHRGHVMLVPVQTGDIVLCVCVERDISDTQNGNMAVPNVGHHEIKDAVIVHVLSEW